MKPWEKYANPEQVSSQEVAGPWNKYRDAGVAPQGAPVSEEGGFITAASKKAGTLVAGIGRGLNSSALEQYGTEVERRNQPVVSSVGGILDKPGTFLAETAGEVAVDIAAQSAATAAGAGIGTLIAPGIGTAIGAGVGRFGYSFLSTYDSIKQEQKREGRDDDVRAIIGAAMSAGIDFFGPVSKVSGKIGESITAKGRERVLSELSSADPATLATYGMRIGKGAAVEGGTEMIQEGIEDQAAAKEMFMPGKEELGKYAFAGIKGAVGGAGVTSVEQVQQARFDKKLEESIKEDKRQTQLKQARQKLKLEKEKVALAREKMELKKEQLALEYKPVPANFQPPGTQVRPVKVPKESQGMTAVRVTPDGKAELPGQLAEQATPADQPQVFPDEDKVLVSGPLNLSIHKPNKINSPARLTGKNAGRVAEQFGLKPVPNKPGVFEVPNQQIQAVREFITPGKPIDTKPVDQARQEQQANKASQEFGEQATIDPGFDDIPLFAAADDDFRGSGMSEQQVTEAANRVKSKYSIQPDVIVFNGMEDLPEELAAVREEAGKRKAANPAGFKYKGKVYINAARMGSEQDVKRVFAHEGIGHLGVELFVGRNNIRNVYGAIAKKASVEVKKYVRNYNLQNEPDGDIRGAMEYVAHLAQTDPKNSLVGRVIFAIRQQLRKIGYLDKRMKLSDNDIIQQYILPARKLMETGSRNSKFEGMTDEHLKSRAIRKDLENSLYPEERTKKESIETKEELTSREAIRKELNKEQDDVPKFDIKSREFLSWFRGSKVVNKDGSPRAMYHATPVGGFEPGGFKVPAHFGTINQARIRDIGIRSLRSFVEGNSGDRPNMIKVYLNIRRPKRVPDVPTGFTGGHVTYWNRQMEQAIEEGYDGLVYQNRYEVTDRFGPHEDSYVAFYPEQIRSAYDPDVAFQKDLKDFSRMGTEGLKRIYIDLIKKGTDEAISPNKDAAKYQSLIDDAVEVNKVLIDRGIDTTKLAIDETIGKENPQFMKDTEESIRAKAKELSDSASFGRIYKQGGSKEIGARLDAAIAYGDMANAMKRGEKDLAPYQKAIDKAEKKLASFEEKPAFIKDPEDANDPDQEEMDQKDEADKWMGEGKVREYRDPFNGAIPIKKGDEKPSFMLDEDTDPEQSEEAANEAGNAILKTGKAVWNLFESSTQTLRKNPLTKALGDAIQNLTDNYKANRGVFNEHLEPVLKMLDTFGRKKTQELENSLTEYYTLRQSGKLDEAQLLVEQDDNLAEAVESIDNALAAFWEVLNKAGVKVYDSASNSYRDIGKVPNYFPNILKPEFRDALRNPYTSNGHTFNKDFQKFADYLIAGDFKYEDDNGNMVKVETTEDALHYVQYAQKTDDPFTGFFGNVERGRTTPFPEEVYDRSLSALIKYRDFASERVAQIQSFGQHIPASGKYAKNPEQKELFEATLEKIPKGDVDTVLLVSRLQKIIYGDQYPSGTITQLGGILNTAATGTQLSGPESVWKNFLGGLTNTFFLGSTANNVRAYRELMSKEGREAAQQIATSLGITQDDYLRAILDLDLQSFSQYKGMEKAKRVASDFTGELMSLRRFGPLKNISWTRAEAAVRIHAMVVGKHQLNEWKRAYENDPNSRQAKVLQRFCNEQGINIKKLMEEEGVDNIKESPQTARFLRRFVDETQGSYRQDQQPWFMDHPLGRFFLKYSKFSVRQFGLFNDYVIKNLGSKDPDLRKEGVKNLLGFMSVYGTGGYFTAWTTSQVFGNAFIPSLTEIMKVLGDDEDKWEKMKYLASVTYDIYDQMAAWGPFGIAYQKWNAINNFGESPLNAPGLAAISDFLNRAWDFSRTTKYQDPTTVMKEVRDWLISNFSLGHQTVKAAANLSDGKLFPMFDAKRTVSAARRASERFLRETKGGKVSKSFGPSESPFSPLQRKIFEALLMGKADEAKAIYQKALDEAETGQEKNSLEKSIKASMKSRRPMDVKGSPSGAAGIKMFDDWAKTHLPEDDYKKIKALDDQYMKAMKSAGLGEPYSIGESNKAVREFKKSLEPLRK